MIPWGTGCEGVKWIEVAQDRVKVRIVSEPVCFATGILLKCKTDLRESVGEDGRLWNWLRILSADSLWN